MFACFTNKNVVLLYQPFLSKGNLLLKDGKEVFGMTAQDAILRLVDLLMLEKDKNTQLQLELQQQKLQQEKQQTKTK